MLSVPVFLSRFCWRALGRFAEIDPNLLFRGSISDPPTGGDPFSHPSGSSAVARRSLAHLSNRKELAGRPDLAPSGSVFLGTAGLRPRCALVKPLHHPNHPTLAPNSGFPESGKRETETQKRVSPERETGQSRRSAYPRKPRSQVPGPVAGTHY